MFWALVVILALTIFETMICTIAGSNSGKGSAVDWWTLVLVLYLSKEENRKTFNKFFSISITILASAMMLGFGTAEASDVQYRVKAGVQNQYVNRAGFVAYDAPILISEIVANKGNFYGGLWNATSMGSEKYGKLGKELDINFGYKRLLGSGQFWNPTVDATLAYYILGDWDTQEDDRYIVDVRLDFQKIPIIQPYVAYRHFGSVGELSKEGDFFWLGASRTQPLGIKPFGGEVSLRVDSSFAFATQGSMGREGGYVFSRIQTSLNVVPLSKKFSLNPFYMVQIPAGDQNGGKRDFVSDVETVSGVFVSAKF